LLNSLPSVEVEESAKSGLEYNEYIKENGCKQAIKLSETSKNVRGINISKKICASFIQATKPKQLQNLKH